jgi:hypothetical protein
MAQEWRVWGEVRTAAPDFSVDLLVLVQEAGRRCGEARGRRATLSCRSGWAAGNNEVSAEALWRQLSDRTLALSGPSPSMLEHLLVGRVVSCWLQLHYWDLLAAQSNESTLRHRECLQRSQERAQRRYLSAIRHLATVRRLQLPTAVQVNFGGQHVNVLDTRAESESVGAFTGSLSP